MGTGHLRRQRDPLVEQQPGGTPGAKPHGRPEASPPKTSVCQRLQEEQIFL